MPGRILIGGAGAIGGKVGAFLKRAGNDVTFVDIEAGQGRGHRDGDLVLRE